MQLPALCHLHTPARPLALLTGDNLTSIAKLADVLHEEGYETLMSRDQPRSFPPTARPSWGEHDVQFIDVSDETWASVAVLKVILARRSPWGSVIVLADHRAVAAGTLCELGVPVLCRPLDREALRAALNLLPGGEGPMNQLEWP